jgi:hypothetical protein
MMVNLRLETHPLGRVPYGMNDLRTGDNRPLLLAFGAAINWFSSGFNASGLRPDVDGDGNPNPPTASGRLRTWHDTHSATGDAHLRWEGFSVDAAVYYRHTEFHNRGAARFKPSVRQGPSRLRDFGATLEAAYFIVPGKFSVGARAAHFDAAEFWKEGSGRVYALRPDANELGVSASYYVYGNNLRLILDVNHVSQQLAFPAHGNLLGVFNSPPERGAFGGSGENSDYNSLWILRLQLQWAF